MLRQCRSGLSGSVCISFFCPTGNGITSLTIAYYSRHYSRYLRQLGGYVLASVRLSVCSSVNSITRTVLRHFHETL